MNTIRKVSVLIILGILTFSCEKEGNETKISTHNSDDSHNNGNNCMNCHKSGGEGEGWFNVAGSVYDANLNVSYPNSTVKLYTSPNGGGSLKYTFEVDGLGNFYTTDKIDFGSGLYPAVTGNNGTKYMSSAITSGQCNSCHNVSTDKIWTN
ncbi:MAG: hypothetical protein ACK5B9_06835 [Flavobacteriia bacterium]|jgi:hypothetical protein